MHPLNEDALIISKFAEISTCRSLSHPSNTSSPKLVTDEGIVIDENAHLQNEEEPMEVTQDGITTLDKDKHPANTFDSILVTDDGIEICMSDVQPSKAFDFITFTEGGITT